LNEFKDELGNTILSLINFKSILDEIYTNYEGSPLRTGGSGGSYNAAVLSNRYA
jgi:hypothetical protein